MYLWPFGGKTKSASNPDQQRAPLQVNHTGAAVWECLLSVSSSQGGLMWAIPMIKEGDLWTLAVVKYKILDGSWLVLTPNECAPHSTPSSMRAMVKGGPMWATPIIKKGDLCTVSVVKYNMLDRSWFGPEK
eukprot:gene25246-10894_t